VAAAGNNGDRNVAYPAAFEGVIAVSALSNNEDGPPILANYSSYGPEIDLAAPGTGIWSTINDHHIIEMSGTSMAAPQVAGLAGLLISNGIPNSQVLSIMKETAFDLGTSGFNEEYGHGMINTYWAVHDSTEINIMVGTRNERNFDIVAETTVSISEKNFTIENVPSGEYEVMAWLDVRNSGHLENGDYFAITDKVTLEDGDYSFELEIEEFIK